MSPRLRSALRTAVIAAGAVVVVASAFAFRREDWPIYTAFALLVALLLPIHVEVLPNLVLPMPSLAVTLGFLYIGGLPILLVYNAAYNAVYLVLRVVRRVLPEPWRSRVPYPVGGAGEVFALPSMLPRGGRAVAAAEHATFALGLGTRLLIARLLAPEGRPASHPGAMAVAEIGGYLCWGVLSMLPILSFRTVLGSTAGEEPALRRVSLLASERSQGVKLAVERGRLALSVSHPDRGEAGENIDAAHDRRAVYQDLGLLMIFALTPFVFLIAHGYEAYGIGGAAVWSLSALALHFMLQRLNERRVMVEEQNRRLEALNRELEHRERLSAIGKMSSVVSHQMLQQLGVIGLHADLIRNAEDAEPAALVAEGRKNAGAIEEALRDVNRVLTDLLVFSRDLRLNLYDHPLGRLVAECAEECPPEAAARAVSLRVDCPGETTVTLDKLKIKQAIANIVRNAIEASPPGGEVVVRTAARDGWAEVAVTDQGAGVPTADRESIFTPFFTTKEQGTGLGLAIAREFTEAHGGRLSVDGERGPGATFVLRLPLRRG